MKVAVILDIEFTIDIRVSNEVRYLTSIGHEVHLICPSHNNQKEFEVINAVSVYRFKFNKSLKNLLFGIMNTLPFYELFWIKKVKEFVKRINPDVLHTHDLYMAKIARKGGSGKLPVVLDLHENYPAAIQSYRWASRFPHRLLTRPNAWRRKEGEYLNYADRIVVLSNSFKESLTHRYPRLIPENIFVYPNVPDITQMLSFQINTNIFPKNNRFILFYFGGISQRRGIFTCFEALLKLAPQIPSVHLLLIGPVDGHEQVSFDKYLNHPLLIDKVTHYPWKNISEFPSYALASDVCLSPIFKNEQHESGVANKVFQYMLLGKPLIVSNCAPQIEIVEGNSCGVVFKSDDSADLAEKIKFLYSNPTLCDEMGEHGKAAALEKYNIEECGKQLAQLYQSIVLE